MPSGSIAVNWPVPTGLAVKKKAASAGPGLIATFTWNKITDTELNILDPGSGATIAYWRVRLNDNTTGLVYNNPIFSLELPLGLCKLCVEVQAVYTFSSSPNVLALSEYCDEVCVKGKVDPYCNNRRKSTTVSRPNVGSRNMRYARAISNFSSIGKGAFR